MEKELRYVDNSEIRASQDSREIDGYAIVFNTLSRNLGGFYERIEPTAVDGVIEQSDIMALLNHDNSRGILARSRFGVGSLTLSADEKGLRYTFSAPKTALGDETLEYLRRGDITQSSFAFTVAEDSWAKQEDGSYIRTIKKFDRLYDVSPVFEPAYFGTDVKCRSFEDFKAEEERKEAEAKAEQERIEKEQREAEEAEKQAKLKEYYDQLRAEYQDALEKGKELNNNQ
jgi:HK97 family phage prohead protease